MKMATSFQDLFGPEDDSLNKGLLDILKCPWCSQYMVPPIRQCSSGHSLCSSCLSKRVACPTCKENFIETRNITLEKIGEKLDFPCIYNRYGCKEKFKLGELGAHQKACKYLTHHCRAAKSCKYVGVTSSLLDHVRASHLNLLLTGNSKELKVSKIDSTGNFMFVFMMSALGELFWLYYKIDGKSGKFMGAVQYVGSEEKAKFYRYEISMSSEGENLAKFVYGRTTHPESEDINHIMQSEKCFCASVKMVQQFHKKENTLYFTVKVEPMCIP